MKFRFRDWVGPVLTILIPLVTGGIHLEQNMARQDAKLDAIMQRQDRLEHEFDEQRKFSKLEYQREANPQWPE